MIGFLSKYRKPIFIATVITFLLGIFVFFGLGSSASYGSIGEVRGRKLSDKMFNLQVNKMTSNLRDSGIRVFRIHLAQALGIELVSVIVRGKAHQVRTLHLRLPDRFGGLDACLLREFVLREDDAVPCFHVARDSHRHIPALGMRYHLH